jgi:hypothetical protein
MWIVRDPAEYLATTRIAELPKPVNSLKDCQSCREETKFYMAEEARGHLLKAHFSGPGIEVLPSDEDLMLWLRTETQIADESLSKYQIEALTNTLNRLLGFYSIMKDIAQSVARKDNKQIEAGPTDGVPS